MNIQKNEQIMTQIPYVPASTIYVQLFSQQWYTICPVFLKTITENGSRYNSGKRISNQFSITCINKNSLSLTYCILGNIEADVSMSIYICSSITVPNKARLPWFSQSILKIYDCVNFKQHTWETFIRNIELYTAIYKHHLFICCIIFLLFQDLNKENRFICTAIS